jgi:RNA polymerase sigma factor (TIGR02999 family)
MIPAMERGEFTQLLREWSAGDRQALEALTPVVYGQLHKLAKAHFAREREGHTLQPTALVHEAYLALVDHKQNRWHGRAHFFSMASRIMREILIDHARRHRAAKRGSGQSHVVLDDEIASLVSSDDRVLALDEGLSELAKVDERKARLLELKYFGGLSGQEISRVLEISISTITRESRLAEAWLQRYLTRT